MAVSLGLGTVQFGLPYGIANTAGQVSRAQVGEILALARRSGVQFLDTAYLYGDAEQVLGQFDLSGFRVVSKLPELTSAAHARDCLETSLSRLNLSQLDSLLLHRPAQLFGDFGDALYQQLQQFKAQGLVKRIGVSVYTPEELSQLLEQFALDLVQLPLNLFDQRFWQQGLLEMCQHRGIAVHLRSVFLQGLLLMPKRPAWCGQYQTAFDTLDSICARANQTPLETCLGIVHQLPGVESAIVGCTEAAELTQILAAFATSAHTANALAIDYQELAQTDDNLISPMRWPRETR